MDHQHWIKSFVVKFASCHCPLWKKSVIGLRIMSNLISVLVTRNLLIFLGSLISNIIDLKFKETRIIKMRFCFLFDTLYVFYISLFLYLYFYYFLLIYTLCFVCQGEREIETTNKSTFILWCSYVSVWVCDCVFMYGVFLNWIMR